MRKTVEKEFLRIEEKAKLVEAEFGSLEEYVMRSTFLDGEHTLRKTTFSSGKCFRDAPVMSDLELAELNDFWAGENGDFETW